LKALGIIAEYNPFHNGHAWHVQQAKTVSGCHGVIAVMSGQFLQRGEPASFDKWRRAKMAVLGGVDLVIELPAAFAVRSAQYFAEGGIRLLDALGIVSHLSFGAECDNLHYLQVAANSASDEKMISQLISNMKQGYTYAKAFSHSVGAATGLGHTMLSSPNNILAIEYLRGIRKFAPHIVPVVIKRRSSNYHDKYIENEFASATAIRKTLEEAGCINKPLTRSIPISTAEILQDALAHGYGPVQFESLASPLLYLLRTLPVNELEQIPGVSEGLQFKVAASALKASSITDLLGCLKSKRYTATRLQRMLIHILLGTKKQDMNLWINSGPLYARILAFNDCGRDMLKEIQNKSALTVITKTAAILNTRKLNSSNMTSLEKMLALDIKASDIYALAIPNPCLRFGGWDFLNSPEYIQGAAGSECRA